MFEDEIGMYPDDSKRFYSILPINQTFINFIIEIIISIPFYKKKMTLQSYFCVFTKHGQLAYEKGMRPTYLNPLIRSLDIRKAKQTRSIQNKYMFCEINKDIVYLYLSTTNDGDYIKKEIDAYHEKDYQSDKFMETTEPMNVESRKPKKGKKMKNSVQELKCDKINDEDQTLDFSEKETINEVVYKIEPIKKAKKKYVFSLFKNTIKKDVLRQKMETHLIEKNVSASITQKIVDDVLENFEDKVSESAFKEKLREVIKNLMESSDHQKIVNDIKTKKGVYVFCFVGVNGVGKSTSLSKICCWLLQHKFKVYIAACDTFRAGAIEQLKVHVEAFRRGGYDVGFFEKGYGKDDAGVAKSAINLAEKEGYDVVLIDTAGRVHVNKNLMDSLSKLIRVNNLDHIIYVGEALIGNDSLDHLKEFNRAIKYGKEEKRIDSLFITKVDTVDDKIGQILNMSISGECPILFIGTGQTNMCLSTIDVDVIADSLMSQSTTEKIRGQQD